MRRARTSLVSDVGHLVARTFSIEQPEPTVDLLATGRIDSLGVVELMASLERHYGIEIELEDVDLANFRSVEAIAEYVVERRGPRNSGEHLLRPAG